VPDDPHWPLARILELMSAILLTCYTAKLFWEWWQERNASDDDDSDTPQETGDGSEVDTTTTTPPAHWEPSAEDVEECPRETPKPELISDTSVGWVEPSAPDVPAHSSHSSEAVARLDAKSDAIGIEIVDCQEKAAEGADSTPAPAERLNDDHAKEKHTLGKLFTISMFGSLDDFAVFVSLMLSGVLSAGQLVVGVFLGSVIVIAVCWCAGLFGCVVRAVEKIPLWCIIGAFAIWTYISTFVMTH